MNDFTVKVTSRPGTLYTWKYKPEDGDGFLTLMEETTEELLVTENGSCKVLGEYGLRSFESLPVSLSFATDEVFVPNVFTANGDHKNPEPRCSCGSAQEPMSG